MSETIALTTGLKNPLDSWKPIAISFYITLVADVVCVGIPFISRGRLIQLGFSWGGWGRV